MNFCCIPIFDFRGIKKEVREHKKHAFISHVQKCWRLRGLVPVLIDRLFPLKYSPVAVSNPS
jgi:hypothetical protein